MPPLHTACIKTAHTHVDYHEQRTTAVGMLIVLWLENTRLSNWIGGYAEGGGRCVHSERLGVGRRWNIINDSIESISNCWYIALKINFIVNKVQTSTWMRIIAGIQRWSHNTKNNMKSVHKVTRCYWSIATRVFSFPTQLWVAYCWRFYCHDSLSANSMLSVVV